MAPAPDRNHQATSAGKNTETLVSVAAVFTDDSPDLDAYVLETSAVLAAHYAYYELLLIDNASDPSVSDRIRRIQHQVPNVRIVRLSRRYSKEIALAAALDNSIGDFVVVMDIGVDPAAMIPQLLDILVSGKDVVIAEWDGRDDPALRRWLSAGFCRVASALLGYTLRPNASYFRAFSRRAVNSIIRIRSKNRYLRCLNGLVGFSQVTVPYKRLAMRNRGSAVLRLLSNARAAADIIISNSAVPLRLASLLGLIASVANFLYFGYILAVTLVKRRLAEGWLTTSITSTTMFFLLFIILAILSEYIARILDETKEQPLYFIESETSSDVYSLGRDKLNVV
jgi:dolichol-phosphate mannosyltransferase